MGLRGGPDQGGNLLRNHLYWAVKAALQPLQVNIEYPCNKKADSNAERHRAAQRCRQVGVGQYRLGKIGFHHLDLYDRIQTACCARLPQTVLHQLQQNKGRRLEPVLELLHQQDADVRGVYHDLVSIHRYYECMVNVSPLEASAEMCALARRTLQTLQQG